MVPVDSSAPSSLSQATPPVRRLEVPGSLFTIPLTTSVKQSLGKDLGSAADRDACSPSLGCCPKTQLRGTMYRGWRCLSTQCCYRCGGCSERGGCRGAGAGMGHGTGAPRLVFCSS